MVQKIKVYIAKFLEFIVRHPALLTVFGYFILVIVGAVVFYFRYPYAYSFSNFYAEDGSVFVKNIIESGFINSATSLFNGYFVLGQYLVMGVGFVINFIFGSGFVTLAKAIAVSSYLFWGIVCGIPWLLFRKKFGSVLTLILVALLWVTPFGGYDYAVIGTIGNLKFAFLFIATILALYRNDKILCNKTWQFIIIDIILLICIMTNIVSLGVLPILLWRYRDDIKFLVLKRKLRNNKGVVSVVTLCLICVIYFIGIYLHGIPKMPGYLDGPLDKSTLIAIFYRGSLYGLLFPISYLLNNLLVLVIFLVSLICIFRSKYKQELIVILYVIIINVVGFVYNRPGVTEFFKTYNDSLWPGHFFYAGTMLFLVGCIFIINDTFKVFRLRNKIMIMFTVFFFVLLIFPAAGKIPLTNRYAQSDIRPTLASEVERICAYNEKIENDSKIVVNLFPSSGWTMSIDKSKVCR